MEDSTAGGCHRSHVFPGSNIRKVHVRTSCIPKKKKTQVEDIPKGSSNDPKPLLSRVLIRRLTTAQS